MARLLGANLSTLVVDSAAGAPVDFKSETLSLDFGISVETEDSTTLGDAWKEALAGLKGGDEFDQVLFYGNGAAESYKHMFARLGVAGTLSFGDGAVVTAMETIITKVGAPINVAEWVKCTVSHKITGAVTVT